MNNDLVVESFAIGLVKAVDFACFGFVFFTVFLMLFLIIKIILK